MDEHWHDLLPSCWLVSLLAASPQSRHLLVRLLLTTVVVAPSSLMVVLVTMIVGVFVVEIITVLFEQGKGRLDDHLQSLVLKCTRLGGCSCR